MKGAFILPVVGCIAAWVLTAGGEAAGDITFRNADGTTVKVERNVYLAQTSSEEMQRRREEFYARQMVKWMREHRREPTEKDLRNNDYLRKLWSAYQSVKAREARERRRREEERKKYLEWKRKRAEERARNDYRKALELYSRKRYREAIARFNAMLANGDFAAYHEDIKAKIQEIEKIGQADVDRANKLVTAEEFEQAMTRYRSVMLRFPGLSCAAEAAKELKRLREDPTVRARIRQKRAAAILARAEEALGKKKYLSAVASLDILLRSYADLPEGKTAKEKLDELKADGELWKSIMKARAEAKAQSLLSLAKSYLNMGQTAKAAQRLRELVSTCPDTPQAKEARTLLEGLPATQPAP